MNFIGRKESLLHTLIFQLIIEIGNRITEIGYRKAGKVGSH